MTRNFTTLEFAQKSNTVNLRIQIPLEYESPLNTSCSYNGKN